MVYYVFSTCLDFYMRRDIHPLHFLILQIAIFSDFGKAAVPLKRAMEQSKDLMLFAKVRHLLLDAKC